MLIQKATASPRPIPLAPNLGNIPSSLTSIPHWVLWSYALKDNKWTKVPKQPSGSFASTANPSTWSTFDKVCSTYLQGGYDGVGIVLDGKPLNDGRYLIGLDFDHCVVSGTLQGDALIAVALTDTYWEISPSGEGIRLFLLHDKPVPARKNDKVDGKSREIYSTGRYLTVTGHTLESKEVRHVA
jgi:primase-polymerase (primpol)-like protein